MYIRIAFFIELRLRVSRSLRSLANYRPSSLAQKPSNGVLACGDPITPSNTVKYHPCSNSLVMRSNSAVGRASYARFCPTGAKPSGEYAQKRLERASPRVLMLTFEHSRWELTRIDL